MKKFLFYIFRYFIGIVFIIAAIPKIEDPAAFAKSIEGYQFLPTFLINITALLIPWIELLVGISIIIGFFLRGTSLLAIILFSSFSILIGISLLRGLSIDCGCFGNLGSPLTYSRLIEDLILLLFSTYVYHIARKSV
ncbi:MAG: putative methylamine utilization protein MauE [Ignavibacteriae bacterium]|nr:MAG: putative methylamine utilization protein MauE [Ignavibacteriota bacterium]